MGQYFREMLYVPELNFVFGEADIQAGAAIISLVRLRQERYRLTSGFSAGALRPRRCMSSGTPMACDIAAIGTV